VRWFGQPAERAGLVMTALLPRFLVVEDDEFQRECLLVMLEEMGATDVLLAERAAPDWRS
jgi:hypothetical protein